MKYLLTLFVLLIFWSFQSFAQERYFHELKGFEDSARTTHLFYRLSQTDSVYVSSWFRENHVRHFNTTTQSDSIIFFSTEKDWNMPGYTESVTIDYEFYLDTPTNWIQLKTLGQGSSPFITDYRSEFIDFPFPVLTKITDDYNFYSWPLSLVLHPSGDSLYLNLYEYKTISFSADTALWPSFGDDYDAMINYFDSTHFDFKLLDIHPTNDSLYFGLNSSGHLFRSDKYSSDFVLADSTTFYSALFFDNNPNYIYGRNRNSLRISDDGGVEDSWTQITLPNELSSLLFVTTDISISGSLFIADSNSVYHSTNFGSTFEEFLDFDSEITGLYKNPNSEILYVLTKTDLYKVENGQPTSIKQVPVSNEENPEIPTSVSLKQNYPNPFNPTTTIRFELDQATFAKLTVYDLLGRKVRELVNEIRPAGTNTIQFDAANLASGIYLYRLEANGAAQTKRLTLIK